MASHRRLDCVAHRPRRGPDHHVGADHEAAVAVDARHDLGLAPIDEADAAHDIRLPQLHRPAALPTLVVAALALPSLGADLAMANQTALDRRASRQRVDALALEPEQDRARPPARMRPAHLHDPRLDRRAHLMRARQRPRTPIGQPSQPLGRVLPPRTSAASHAPSGMPPHSGAPHPSPAHHQREPPAPPDSAVPPGSTPRASTASSGSAGANNPQQRRRHPPEGGPRVSARVRGHRRPGPGSRRGSVTQVPGPRCPS